MRRRRLVYCLYWIDDEPIPVDFIPVEPEAISRTGYRHADIIPRSLLEDVLEIEPPKPPPAREIGNPYRFRRQR